MSQHYRVIVVGCGAIGAATAYWLSRRLGGDAVLALEQYQLGHDRGASEDHSRVIRHAYTRTDYTALTPAAYQSWNVAEQETGLQLVHRTGSLIIAEQSSAGMESLEASATAMAASGLPFELLSGARVSDLVDVLAVRVPALRTAPGMVAVNLTYVQPDFELHDGDEAAFIPPVSGG